MLNIFQVLLDFNIDTSKLYFYDSLRQFSIFLSDFSVNDNITNITNIKKHKFPQTQ